jgi:hypothetical protein
LTQQYGAWSRRVEAVALDVSLKVVDYDAETVGLATLADNPSVPIRPLKRGAGIGKPKVHVH